VQALRRFARRVLGRQERAGPDTLDYVAYWRERYRKGNTSGTGSYGRLAAFKAEVINGLLRELDIASVIEFGCGDGHNLGMIEYPEYLGLDIAPTAIVLCAERYAADPGKSFFLYHPVAFANKSFLAADMVVCLDVLYHIIDEADFRKTLADIFSCAGRFVLLYTTLGKHELVPYTAGSHIRHRDTLAYLTAYSDFGVDRLIPQRYPDLSSAEFILLRRKERRGKACFGQLAGRRVLPRACTGDEPGLAQAHLTSRGEVEDVKNVAVPKIYPGGDNGCRIAWSREGRGRGEGAVAAVRDDLVQEGRSRGVPKKMRKNSGYHSEQNVRHLRQEEVDIHVAVAGNQHGECSRPSFPLDLTRTRNIP